MYDILKAVYIPQPADIVQSGPSIWRGHIVRVPGIVRVKALGTCIPAPYRPPDCTLLSPPLPHVQVAAYSAADEAGRRDGRPAQHRLPLAHLPKEAHSGVEHPAVAIVRPCAARGGAIDYDDHGRR